MGWKKYSIVIYAEIVSTALLLYGLIKGLMAFSTIVSSFIAIQGIIFASLGAIMAYQGYKRKRKENYNYED